MTLYNDKNFEKELTYHFKIDMIYLTNFETRSEKSRKFAL